MRRTDRRGAYRLGILTFQGETDFERDLEVADAAALHLAAALHNSNRRMLLKVWSARLIANRIASSMLSSEEPTSSTTL